MNYFPNHAVIVPSETLEIDADGITLWYNSASSYRYSGVHDRTYYAYTNSESQVVLRYFDHDTGILSAAVIVDDLPQRSDDHLSPAITIIQDGVDAGKILLAYSHHSSDMFIYQSDAAESIDSFSQTAFLDGFYTYPAFVTDDNGDISLFFREGFGGAGNPKGQYNFITSIDDGMSWSASNLGIGFDNPWFTYGLPPQYENGELFVAFTYADTSMSGSPNALGYSISLDGGQNWSSTQGAVDELLPETVLSIGGLEDYRLIDSVNFNGEWLVSITESDTEFLGLGETATGKIVRVSDGAVLYQSDVAVNYYADGFHFDDVDPRLFYYSSPDSHIAGGGNVIGVLMDVNFETSIFETVFVSNEGGTAIRPNITIGAEEIGTLNWIEATRYNTYFDFETSLSSSPDGAAIYDFSLSTKGLRGDLTDSSNNHGAALGLDLEGYNSLIGSVFSDSLRGDEGDNTLWGYGSRDFLSGFDGNDRLEGGQGNDFLSGGNGDDILMGGADEDKLIGGTGFDFADYSDGFSVTADLNDSSQNTGIALGDSFNSIEGLIGTDGDDILRGNRFENTLIGGAGDDILQGGARADVLDGGLGFDIADYSEARSVRADLADASVNGGNALGDIYVSIEGLIGSSGRDSLRGDAGDNLLVGGGETDFLSGREGDDTVIGGQGDDYLWGNAGADVFVFNSGDGVDQIRDFNILEDKLEFSFAYDAGLFGIQDGAAGIEITYGDDSILIRNVSLEDYDIVIDPLVNGGFELSFI